jgi:hypothetical protein
MNCCCVTRIHYRNKQSSKVTMLIVIPYYLLSLDYLCYEVGGSMAIATWVPAYLWKSQSGGSMHACMLISPNAMAHLTSLWADVCINVQELPYCAHASWELLEAWKFKSQIELGQSHWTFTKKCPAYSTTSAVPHKVIWFAATLNDLVLCACSLLKCHYIHNAVVHTPTIVTGFGPTPWWWRF